MVVEKTQKSRLELLINLCVWHLKPYSYEYTTNDVSIIEFGFLCFKLVSTYRFRFGK